MNRRRPSSGAGAGSRPLMAVEAARALIRSRIRAAGSNEEIPLGRAVDRVLAVAPQALNDSPTADNSALDGFAVRGVDLAGDDPVRLLLVGQSPAGHPSSARLGAGEALRIMTGGVMPEGADTVVAIERARVRAEGDRSWIELSPPLTAPGSNVRPRGEDVRAGSQPVAAGVRLRPAQIAMLASIGAARVQVYPRVRAAVLSTGDELQPLDGGGDKPLQAGEVFDSNRWLLHALLRRLDAEVIDCGLIRDRADRIAETLRAAADRADLVISSGGVSTGDADFLPRVLGDCGHIWFRGVAMRPGRPFMAGSIADTPVFSLPGNPVAVAVCFYRFVKEAVQLLAGEREPPPAPLFYARAAGALRKSPGREEYQRGRLRRDEAGQLWVDSTGGQGAGKIHSLGAADCLVVLPAECERVEAGDRVAVQPFEGLV